MLAGFTQKEAALDTARQVCTHFRPAMLPMQSAQRVAAVSCAAGGLLLPQAHGQRLQATVHELSGSGHAGNQDTGKDEHLMIFYLGAGPLEIRWRLWACDFEWSGPSHTTELYLRYRRHVRSWKIIYTDYENGNVELRWYRTIDAKCEGWALQGPVRRIC
jgi:hypothetical protein